MLFAPRLAAPNYLVEIEAVAAIGQPGKEGVTVEHVMEFDNVETVKQAVEIDAGVAIVPQSTVASEVTSRMLVEIPIDGADMNRPWAAIYKNKKVLSPAMKQLIETLKGQP